MNQTPTQYESNPFINWKAAFIYIIFVLIDNGKDKNPVNKR